MVVSPAIVGVNSECGRTKGLQGMCFIVLLLFGVFFVAFFCVIGSYFFANFI